MMGAAKTLAVGFIEPCSAVAQPNDVVNFFRRPKAPVLRFADRVSTDEPIPEAPANCRRIPAALSSGAPGRTVAGPIDALRSTANRSGSDTRRDRMGA